ncbi:MAG: ATP synthase F1 subunit delta [Clostridia bacterium]|nr:ATP synthase F1 subunit delta [Clostridia bacterium]
MMQTEREYAEAMFALAAESGESEIYLDALTAVRGVLLENPEYVDFLSSPAIPLAERCAAIDEAFGSCPEHVPSFLKILCENSRVKNVCECIDEFEKLVLLARNIVTATVYSVVELDKEQKERLVAKLERVTGKSVEIEYKIDAALLGGIRVELDGVTFDGSIKGRLDEVKEVIIG